MIILLAPVNFGLGGEYGEYAHGLSFKGRVGWAGGLLGFKITYSEGNLNLVLQILGLNKILTPRDSRTPRGKKPSREKGRPQSGGSILSIINRQLFSAVSVFLGRLVRALHLDLKLSGRYGFDDPCLTGMSAAIIAVLNRGGSSVDLNPDFSGETVEIRGSIRGWFIPLHILVIALVFLLKKPVRAVWWSQINFKRKQKEVVQYA